MTDPSEPAAVGNTAVDDPEWHEGARALATDMTDRYSASLVQEAGVRALVEGDSVVLERHVRRAEELIRRRSTQARAADIWLNIGSALTGGGVLAFIAEQLADQTNPSALGWFAAIFGLGVFMLLVGVYQRARLG